MLGRRSFLKTLGLGALFPVASSQKGIAEPQHRRIHLVDVFIAGFQYYDGMRKDVIRSLRVDDEVILKREPENKYDENAIEVYTPAGHKLGYLPRSDNTVIAAIADQDIDIGAELSLVDPDAPSWERVAVRVYQVISSAEMS
jgi:hypothetical protein